jgi:integration host factor subunit alpha
MTVTKANIVSDLCRKCNVSKNEAAYLVELFLECIKDTLQAGEPVKIFGFGNFSVHEKNPRPGRNPRTGEEVTISRRKVVTFKMNHSKNWL